MAEESAMSRPRPAPSTPAQRLVAGHYGRDAEKMSRTVSMDFREEREDLKKAAEESLNAILELDLEGNVRWVSPSWQDFVRDAQAVRTIA